MKKLSDRNIHHAHEATSIINYVIKEQNKVGAFIPHALIILMFSLFNKMIIRVNKQKLINIPS